MIHATFVSFVLTCCTICPSDGPLNIKEHHMYNSAVRSALFQVGKFSNCELRQEAERRVQELIQQAEKHYDISIPPTSVEWRPIGTSSGKNLCPDQHTIVLNELMYIANQKYFVETTIPHEVAHSVECARVGKLEHHKEVWAEAMEILSGKKKFILGHSYDPKASCALLRTLIDVSPERKEQLLAEVGIGTVGCLMSPTSPIHLWFFPRQ